MTTTAVSTNQDRSLAEILAWWLMLVIFAAAALLLRTTGAGAQQTGPLPAATPSDAPPPPPRASAPTLIGGKPNLSGTWALNKDESDDPRQAMQEAAGSNRGNGGNGNGGGPRIGMGGGGGGWGGGGGGWGGRNGGAGNGSNGGGRRSGQGGGENAMNDLSQLTVAQTATSATVTGDSGHILAQYSADGPSQSAPTMKDSTPGSSGTSNSSASSSTSSPPASGGTQSSSNSDSSSGNSSPSAPPVAQWQGSQLVAVQQGRRQGTTTRTFELSPDGKQLYVTTKIDNPRFNSPVTFRLVYDPASASE
jgi:hypothetical protein